MQKSKDFKNVKFSAEIISQALNKFIEFIKELPPENRKISPYRMSIDFTEDEMWVFDKSSEFFTEYSRDILRSSFYSYEHIGSSDETYVAQFTLIFTRGSKSCWSSVSVGLKDRHQIDEIYLIFEKAVDSCKTPEIILPLPIVPEQKIFIGHGRDPQWRDLKDHLTDKHGFKVIAFETGPKGGKSIKEVLQDLTKQSSFAILILTGENIHKDGEAHARDNVIHEVGLFQGSLGFGKVIILLEEGVNEFSNILGLHQYRFSKANIKEVFGDVVAAIQDD